MSGKNNDLPPIPSLQLDLKLARQRFKSDTHDDFFPDPIDYRDLLSGKGEAAVDQLLGSEYVPSETVSLDVPKADFTLRHCIQLQPLDRILYQALAQKLAISLDSKLPSCVYSHRLEDRERRFLRNPIRQFKSFEIDIVEELRQGGGWLVKTDLTQFFENIHLKRLTNNIRVLLGDRPQPEDLAAVKWLERLLKKWSPFTHRGLPQNMEPSSFLSNAFLCEVDREMIVLGRPYFRYVDDIRIVAKSESDARIALQDLIISLREVGQGVNSAKTRIVAPNSPEMEVELQPEDPTISRVEALLSEESESSFSEAAELVRTKTLELLAAQKTNERIFRFCINRLQHCMRAAAGTGVALGSLSEITSQILGLLPRRPAETDSFCKYLELAELGDQDKSIVSRLISTDPLLVYPWQNYQLWLLVTKIGLKDEAMVQKALITLKDSNNEPEFVGAALYLARVGDDIDRASIERRARERHGHLVRRGVTVALQEKESARQLGSIHKKLARESSTEDLAGFLADSESPEYPKPARQLTLQELPLLAPDPTY